LHNGSVITSKSYPTIANSLQEKPLMDDILRKARWNSSTFSSINWDAHERVLHHKTRQKQCVLATLIHGLANTHQQNKMFYGQSDLGPVCLCAEETFEHVLKCNNPWTNGIHTEQLLKLEKLLNTHSMPCPVTRAIMQLF
jgi:hypothetical protein